MTAPPPLVVLPGREGHRRRFRQEERQQILAEAEQPGASLSEIARRYDVDRRMLCRWKQKLVQPPARFVTLQIVETQSEETLS